MFRKFFPVFAALCCMILLAACGGSKEGLRSDEPTPTVTHAAKLPTSEPSPTPTSTPTPTPGAEELLAKSGELHEVVLPTREIAKIATGALVNGAEKERIAYGVTWNNPLPVWDGYKPGNVKYPQLEGMKADNVQIAINERLNEIVTAMTDNAFLPEVEGIAEILEEFGSPGVELNYEVTLSREGLFSVRFVRTWRWKSEGKFDFLSQAGDYMRERWPEDDDRFISRYEYLESDKDGKASVRMFFQIDEAFGVTFNLRTGKEILMSDLFAEGSDYISYINGELTKIYRDDYLYGPLLTNQGVTIPGIDGQENFYLIDNGESIELAITGKLHGSDAKVKLTDPVGIEAPWRLSKDTGGYVFRPLGALVMTNWSHEADHEPVIGNVTFRPDGGDEISVAIHFAKKDYMWTENLGTDQSNRIDRWLTEAKLLDIVRQALPMSSPDLFGSGSEYNLVFESALLFPNGYSHFVFYMGGAQDMYVYEAIHVWLKDGQCISDKEIFDASYEQILAEMITGVHFPNSVSKITAEEVESAAKLLAKYFRFDISDDFFGKAQGEAFHWEVVSFGDFDYRYEGRVYSEDYLPTEVRANLPEEMMTDLSWERHVTHDDLIMTDPLTLWKHLRLYEGCKFRT